MKQLKHQLTNHPLICIMVLLLCYVGLIFFARYENSKQPTQMVTGSVLTVTSDHSTQIPYSK